MLRGIGQRIPFLNHRVDDHLERARAYLKRRGGMAVLVGRFTAALRVMVPGLAGMADMHYPTFLAFNALGGAIWGTAFALLGYFAGAAWERVAGYASTAGLALLALVIVGLVLVQVLRNVREGGEPVTSRLARSSLIAWLRRTLPRTSAWLARRLDTSSPRGFMLSLVLSIGVFSAWLFGAMAQDVVAHEEAVRYDPGILRFVVEHRTGWLTTTMKAFTWLGSNATLIPLVIGVCLWFVWHRRPWRIPAGLVVALGGVEVLYQITKTVVARPRPPVAFHVVHASGYAFPSGHAAQALAGWGAIAIALSAGRSIQMRLVEGSATAALILLIGLSRIYLGVNWFTDVVGGFALAGLWLSAIGVMLLWHAPRPKPDEATDATPQPLAA
jgi:membrane-associated phospholipid phosphatase